MLLARQFATGMTVIIGLWQLPPQFAMSKRSLGRCYMAAITDEQVKEFERLLKNLGNDYEILKALPGQFLELQKDSDFLRKGSKPDEKIRANGRHQVGCHSMAWRIAVCDRRLRQRPNSLNHCRLPPTLEKLETVFPDESKRVRIFNHAKNIIGAEVKAGGALNPGDIPLPTV